MLVKRWQRFRESRAFEDVRIGMQTATAHRVKQGRYVNAYNQSAYGFVVTPQGKQYVIGIVMIDPRRHAPASQSVVPLFADTVRLLMQDDGKER